MKSDEEIGEQMERRIQDIFPFSSALGRVSGSMTSAEDDRQRDSHSDLKSSLQGWRVQNLGPATPTAITRLICVECMLTKLVEGLVSHGSILCSFLDLLYILEEKKMMSSG